jgi:oligoendopeptidase F
MVTLAYQSTRWSLSDLFESQNSPDMQAALVELETLVAQFEAHRPRLQAEITTESFLSVVKDYEAINHLARRIYSFAGLSFAADTQDQAIQAFMAHIDQIVAELDNRSLFFSLWWKALDEANARRLMASSGDYRYWLEEMRHFKPHTLSEAEEKIINIKNVTGVNALSNLYDTITNRYTFKLSVEGEERELTRGEVMVYARSSDPELRSAAYRELYRVYGDDGPILGQIYQTIVRDWRNEQVELRHYANPISARNLSNDIPDQVVDTLLSVCQRNGSLFQRFFQLKARLLGMPRLRRYDIYAPVAKSDKTYEFSQAASMVMESFQRFDPRFADLARRVFDDHHLDSEVRKGKRSGAFCWTVVPDRSPWVLLNYQRKPEDVATMAHELGHAIHSMLAEHHTVFTQQASLPLAETASTFGEMMLVDRLLADEQDEAVRRDLLFKQVDDSYATIMRQAFFALFERQAHAMIKNGASIEELSTAYMQNLEGQFGEAVALSDDFRWEWVSIPHIYHTPFYVYAYAFGQLLVLSLYRQFRQEGESFKPRYIEILSAGGSDSPANILARAGIDIYEDAFWQGGFDVVSELIDQLEVLNSK